MSEVKQILEGFGKQSQDLIRESLASNRINASGRLSESVSYQVKDGGFVFVLTISANDYIFSAMQEGTSPEEAQKDPFQLRKDIDKWIVSKPVKFPGKDRGTTNALISRKILREGTVLWRRYGSKGKTTGRLEAIFSDKRIDKIAEQLEKAVEDQIIEGFVKFGRKS